MRLVPRMVRLPAKGFELEWTEAVGKAKENVPSVQVMVKENLCPACVAKRDSKGGKVFTPTARPALTPEQAAAHAELRAIAVARRDIPIGKGRAIEPTVEDIRSEIAQLRKQLKKGR
jgi:hypothetical protein